MKNNSYDDIINLPHPVSKNHPQMPLRDRAAQFAPFAALTGHDAAIKEIPGKGIQPIVNDLRGYYKTKRVDGKKKSVWVPSILLTDEENTRYCYKIDLHHYYQSINHEVLKQKFRKVFKDPELLWLLDEIADSINTATEEDLIELYCKIWRQSYKDC